jgi:Fe-S-cluster containining protein
MARIDLKVYENGIRFACQCSGKCCRNRDGYERVYVSLEERRRLAKRLHMSLSAFTRRYCLPAEGEWSLGSKEDACVFLTGGACSVYEDRPLQCRTWPFWPENMNQRTWAEVTAFCPGVGKGPVIPAGTVERILEEQAAADEGTPTPGS